MQITNVDCAFSLNISLPSSIIITSLAKAKQLSYEILYSLFNEEDESIWKQALKAIRTLIEKTSDISYIEDILKTSLKGFESFDQYSPLYDKLIYFFCEMLESKSQKSGFNNQQIRYIARLFRVAA